MATGIQVHRVITYKDCFVFLVTGTKADGVVCGRPLVCQVTHSTRLGHFSKRRTESDSRLRSYYITRFQADLNL